MYKLNIVWYILILFQISCSVAQQPKSTEEEIILKQELLRNKDLFTSAYTKTVIADSIIIAKQIIPIQPINHYFNVALSEGYMTESEAIEIFGSANSNLYSLSPYKVSYWTQESFPNLKVILFDNVKYSSGYITKPSKTIGLGILSIRAISRPLIRKDGKYALVAWASEHYGDNISIYKNVNGQWVFYKGFAFM